MRVLLVCAAPRGSRTGNRRTAERWAHLLRQLGHRVRIAAQLAPADLVVALHARHSAAAVARATVPVILALTGTDLYHDIHTEPAAAAALDRADRIVVLHDRALVDVPLHRRQVTRVIRQSARAPVGVAKLRRGFRVVVIGHLREVKDPLAAARAARLVPASSRIEVVAAGRALEPALAEAARAEARANPRYRWLGEVSAARALRLIATAHLLALTSRSEGGANVLGEAIVCGTPVVASDIPASRAALGDDYPALYPFGDDAALARLVARVESEPTFRAKLERRVRARRPLFAERTELAAWRALLAELTPGARSPGRTARPRTTARAASRRPRASARRKRA
jgi:putative glycosyltransferase (TIGR04348 family)